MIFLGLLDSASEAFSAAEISCVSGRGSTGNGGSGSWAPRAYGFAVMMKNTHIATASRQTK